MQEKPVALVTGANQGIGLQVQKTSRACFTVLSMVCDKECLILLHRFVNF